MWLEEWRGSKEDKRWIYIRTRTSENPTKRSRWRNNIDNRPKAKRKHRTNRREPTRIPTGS